MIDPIVNGANLMLAIFNSLPLPFRAFTFLIAGTALVTLIVKLIMR